jgi:hypothetical protein
VTAESTIHPAQWSRAIWAASEPFVLGMLFAPEARARLAELGVPDKATYIAVRSAPMGRAAPAVVTAAFHGFPHAMILEVLPGLWELVTPEEVIATHYASLPIAAERVFGGGSDTADLTRFADLLTGVCADLDTAGRPLAASNQALRPPAEPWARFWHACTTLREYRGDAHIAALVTAELSVAESLVLTAAWAAGRIDADMLRKSRRLSDDVVAGARAALAGRQLMAPDGSLTREGAGLREHIEAQTDVASLRPWNALTAIDAAALYQFLNTLSTGMIDAGAMRAVTPVGAPWPPSALSSETQK